MDHAYRYHYWMLRSNALSAGLFIFAGVLLNFLNYPDWIGGLGVLLAFTGIFWITFTAFNWMVGSTWLARQSVLVAFPDPDPDRVSIEPLVDKPGEVKQ